MLPTDGSVLVTVDQNRKLGERSNITNVKFNVHVKFVLGFTHFPVYNVNILQEKCTVLYIPVILMLGNLGTIIRIADWFGITNILCSEDTVDVYNPKTIQATMG